MADSLSRPARSDPDPASLSHDTKILVKEAGLTFSHIDHPGITRHRAGKGFFYRDVHGDRVTDKVTLARIKALAIPPAWTGVWIAPRATGHIQATGYDARGRKQYRYHERWREVRDEAKYHRMLAFGEALPCIRKRVDEDMRKRGLPREKVLATIVHLLETTLIRVGNERYAKENGSVGLTTMRNRHAEVTSGGITFSFTGKSGIEHEVELKDRRVARIIKHLQDLPGQQLFQYVDEAGERQQVHSDDVNAYLHAIAGEAFTAKDFRTWAGTVLAAQALAEYEAVDSDAAANHAVVRAIESVAATLGNTREICRKCYVHPAVLDAFLDGETVETIRQRADIEIARSLPGLEPEEAAVLILIRSRLENGSG